MNLRVGPGRDKNMFDIHRSTGRDTLTKRIKEEWNGLPLNLRVIDSISKFKRGLKTFYFNQAFSNSIQWIQHIKILLYLSFFDIFIILIIYLQIFNATPSIFPQIIMLSILSLWFVTKLCSSLSSLSVFRFAHFLFEIVKAVLK